MYFRPKIGRKIIIFSLDRKNNILMKKVEFVERIGRERTYNNDKQSVF